MIAVVAAILFTAYLIYDLQLLMGGRKYQISPDEYIFAAVSIYLDIVQARPLPRTQLACMQRSPSYQTPGSSDHLAALRLLGCGNAAKRLWRCVPLCWT